MITEDGIKIEWMNHFPAQVRVVLSENTNSSLDIAVMADKMMKYSELDNIAAVTSSQPDSAQPTSHVHANISFFKTTWEAVTWNLQISQPWETTLSPALALPLKIKVLSKVSKRS